MSDAPDELPRPGDWIVWESNIYPPHLGRVVRRINIRRSDGLENDVFHVEPTTSDSRRVRDSHITTVIRTGEDGEGDKILELLQHDRPDIRSMALRAIAEHTGDRWEPPRHTALTGWTRSDDDA